MIPSDVKLFTWIDVEEVFLRAQKDHWPEGLVWVQAYWDGVELGFRQGEENCKKIVEWLDEIFAPRFDAEKMEILLVSRKQQSRSIPVWFKETEEEPREVRFEPSLSRPMSIRPGTRPDHPKPLGDDLPLVTVFHSFKGGVGRTLMSVAMAQAIINSDDQAKVLLIDGDLEAPGLTWLIKERFPEFPVAFSDFLALVHGDPDPSAESSIALTVEQLQSLFLDGVYILPAFRTENQFSSLEVKPEHLIQGAEDPYRLTPLLARLGKKLDVNAVIVDLRAGLSELATGLLLDPRTYRVIVTTLSEQSLKGTANLLELLSDLSLSTEDHEPLPAIVVTKVLGKLNDSEFISKQLDPLTVAAEPFLSQTTGRGEDLSADLPIQVVEYQEDFLTLPADWNRVCRLLKRHEVVKQMKHLLDWAPISTSDVSASSQLQDKKKRCEMRTRLAEFAGKLVYAEKADIDKFLTIRALHNLSVDFKRRLPLAIVIGPKGSGKTYTYLQLVRRQEWQAFAKDALGREIPQSAHICPVLKPKNLLDRANELVESCRQHTRESLQLEGQYQSHVVGDYIRDKFKKDLHEGDWRKIWLNVIAWSIGFQFHDENAEQDLGRFLRDQKQQVVAVIDGLEDFFQTIEGKKNKEVALRSLLQEVPEWLRQQPDRPLGLLVFVREDMVVSAVRQNPQQLIAKYEPYALNWEVDEALRLVYWIASETNILSKSDRKPQDLGFEELSDILFPLWGRKLGPERSREARSARWVIAALSDFKGRIQARDLVRFLNLAANKSIVDDYWEDRVLVPAAVRSAVKDCGEKKMDELGQETPELGEIFSVLKEVPSESRQIPFAPDEVGLSSEQIEILESNGIITREGSKYHLAELFRRSLEFKSVGRSKVLALARRTWQSVD